MDYSLADVAKMGSPDVSLDDVRRMPTNLAIAKQNENDKITLGAKNFARDMSLPDQVFAGAGKAVSDMGLGLRQIGGMFGIGDAKKLQAEVDDAKSLDAPLMNTGGGLAGNIGGNVAMTLLPAGVALRGAQAANMGRTALVAQQFVNPTSWAGAIGAGAATGAIQPVSSGDSRGLNTALGAVGGAGGQAVVRGLARVAQPVVNSLDPVAQRSVDTLRAAGVPLDLAQTTGSPVWGRIGSALNDNLFTMGGQAAKRQAQQEAFTNAALGSVGAAGKATSDVMGPAAARINGVFKDVLDRNPVQARPDWITALADTHAGALENEKQPVANIINRVFDSLDPKTSEISGQVAYGIKKDLDRMASSSDSTQNYLARQARSALMDGINGSLSGADQKAFAQARGQFANMKKLEGAISTDGLGTISAPKLANIMGQKANRGASIYGNGPQDLVDLAQAGKQVLGDKTPNSGTAARLMAMTALPGAALGGADALHEYLKEDGDLLGALGHGASVAGGVFAAPKAAQYLLNNPRMVGLLSGGVQSPVMRGLLQAPSNNLLASQAARALPESVVRSLLLPAAQ